MPILNLYGLTIGVGIWCAALVAQKAQQRLVNLNQAYSHFNPDHLLPWVIIGGIFGARLYHVVDFWEYYSLHPVKIIAIWEGGIGIFGALLGGFLGIICYRLFQKKPTIPKVIQKSPALTAVLDVIAVGLPIGQAIGRLGNYFNQELFGLPTQLPWGVYIAPSNRPFQFAQFSQFHPLFFYEAILNLGLAVILWLNIKYARPTGWYFALYLVGYGLIRFSLDFLRIEPWRLGFLTTAQWLSLILAILGLVWIYFLSNSLPTHRQKK